MPDRTVRAPEIDPETGEIRAGRRANDVVVAREERRGSPRYAFTATAEVVDMKSRTRMNTRISDLGLQGCYVDTNAPFPIGIRVRIRITASKRAFECQGDVVYSLPNMGMGIRFGEIDASQSEILNKWIGEISGETEADFEHSELDGLVSPDASTKDAQLYVLQELVITLMRKKTLSKAEGKALLQRLAK